MIIQQKIVLFVLLIMAGNASAARAISGSRPTKFGARMKAQLRTSRTQKELDSRLIIAAENNDIAAVRSLLSQHAHVNATDQDGVTALMYSRDPNITRLLLDHGARVNAKNHIGWTALLIAANSYYGNDIVPLLVDYRAFVHNRSPVGDTPLTLSAGGFQIHSISALLSHGAKINCHDRAGRTPLMCASLSLREWGENSSMEPYQDEAPKTVEYLITHGASMEARDNEGMTALMWASHVVEYFSDQASESVACGILSTLLKHHANVNTVDYDGNTPLIWAARIGPYGVQDEENLHVRYAKLLLAHGANPRIRNQYGATCLDIARANGFHRLAALFETAGKKSHH